MITTSGRLQLDRLERGIGIGGLGDHGDTSDTVQDADESAAYQFVIVAEHDPDGGLVRHV